MRRRATRLIARLQPDVRRMTPGSTAEPNNLRGAVLLALAACVFTLEVTMLRLASGAANDAQIVFFRALAQLVVSLAIVLSISRDLIRTRRPGLQILRGLASLATWWLYYWSFRVLDMALATTLTFTTSLFVIAFAAPILGEKVGGWRIGATIAGFIGVVIATGTSLVALETGVIVGLASAAAAALIVFLNRALARTEPTATIMLYIGLVTTLGTAPVAALYWQPLPASDFALVSLTGAFGALGMWLTIEAYRVGEVSALAPVPYVRIVIAILFGVLLFGEIPSWSTLIGATIIITATVALTRHERQRRGLAAPHR